MSAAEQHGAVPDLEDPRQYREVRFIDHDDPEGAIVAGYCPECDRQPLFCRAEGWLWGCCPSDRLRWKISRSRDAAPAPDAAPVVILGYNNCGTRLGCATCSDPYHEKANVGVEYRTVDGDHVCDACGEKYAGESAQRLHRFLWDTGLADCQLWDNAELVHEIASLVSRLYPELAPNPDTVSW